MNEKIKTRIDKAKAYVRQNAPQVITAAAAVGSLIALSRVQKDVHHVKRIEQEKIDNYVHSAKMMHACVKENRKYRYEPNIGVLVYPEGHKLFEDKE